MINLALLPFLLHHDTDKPRLNGSSSPDPITIRQGDPLHLDCSAVGNPEPTYVWVNHQSSNSSSSEGSVFMITSVTPADEGLYECIVRNNVGDTAVVFNVTVIGEFTL